MIKLSASVSKKVPVPDVEFSSRCYSAGMEVEVPSGAEREELKEKIRALYGLLEDSIDEQMKGRQEAANPGRGSSPAAAKTKSSASRTEGAANSNGRRATKAQLRAIHAIAKERGYSEQELEQLLSGTFGVEKPSALSIGEASALIDSLKGNGKEGAHED